MELKTNVMEAHANHGKPLTKTNVADIELTVGKSTVRIMEGLGDEIVITAVSTEQLVIIPVDTGEVAVRFTWRSFAK